MKSEIKRENLVPMLQKIADMMAEKKDELGELDSKLGDGDLGLTMSKGYGALPEIAASLEEPDLGKAIAKAGMKMSSIVPSTMGFLMSSGLMTGGKAISGKSSMDAAAYPVFLRGFADGIIKRGKCAPGDRTILDALDGAAAASEKLLSENPGASLLEAARAAEQGAENGAEATKEMEPKFGKAAVHKAAAKGIVDQGALAGLYVVRALREFIEE